MRCPFCKENRDKVIDSRESADGFVIRRRRECESCDRRFTTRERIEETPLRVIKRDGTREDFERRKILMGLLTRNQIYWKKGKKWWRRGRDDFLIF